MTITSTTRGQLNFVSAVPERLGYLKIPGSQMLHAEESFANIFYQKYQTADYSFWLSAYTAKEDHVMYIHRDGPMIGFKVMLKQNMRYTCETGEIYFKQGQFLFAQVPYIDSLFSLKQGREYFVFDMALTVDFLRRLNLQVKSLDRFLDSTQDGKMRFLLNNTMNSSIVLLDSIEYLRHHPADRQAAAKVVEALFSTVTEGKSQDLPEYKIERMYEAREIIRFDITRHITIPNLAHMVGTNSRDLKTDFVKVFSIPPGQYLQYERMKAAKQLLLNEPDLTVNEIAVRVGFKNSAAFDPAFKDNVGTTPSEFRRSNGA
ncbi:AraC family transcriptional regulator [Filimonas effusa]|nr:AraC family transcriptional regulator [Filimonas effusa]